MSDPSLFAHAIKSFNAIYEAGYLLVLASARIFGLTIMFSAFSWGQIGTGVIRMTVTICLAAPIMAAHWPHANAILTDLTLPVPLLLVKEVFIGGLMGFVCSLPFQSLVASGSLIDTTRGVSSPISSPTGESSPLGLLFEGSAIWLFASMSGFWYLADAIYASFALWPITGGMPEFNSKALSILIELVDRIGVTIVILAGPMLILMLLCDGAVYVSTKLGKRMNVGGLSPNIKNIVVIAILPLFISVLLRVVSGRIEELISLRTLIDQLAGVRHG